MAITTPRASRTVCGRCTTEGAAVAAAGACASSDCVDRRIVAIGGDGATGTGAGAGRIGSVLTGGDGGERVCLLRLRWRRRNSRPEGGGVEGGGGGVAGSAGSGELSGGAGGAQRPVRSRSDPSGVLLQVTGDDVPRAAAGPGWLTVDASPPFAAWLLPRFGWGVEGSPSSPTRSNHAERDRATRRLPELRRTIRQSSRPLRGAVGRSSRNATASGAARISAVAVAWSATRLSFTARSRSPAHSRPDERAMPRTFNMTGGAPSPPPVTNTPSGWLTVGFHRRTTTSCSPADALAAVA